MQKVGIYTPFPDLTAQRHYFALVETIKTQQQDALGLSLGYESYQSRHSVSGSVAQINHDEFNEYRKHIKELMDFREVHVKKFQEGFKNKDQIVTVEKLRYPLNKEEKSSLLLSYTENDMLFVNAHGNPDDDAREEIADQSNSPSSATPLPENTNPSPLIGSGALANSTQPENNAPRRSTRLRQPSHPSGSSNS